jgi:hypothetical protein
MGAVARRGSSAARQGWKSSIPAPARSSRRRTGSRSAGPHGARMTAAGIDADARRVQIAPPGEDLDSSLSWGPTPTLVHAEIDGRPSTALPEFLNAPFRSSGLGNFDLAGKRSTSCPAIPAGQCRNIIAAPRKSSIPHIVGDLGIPRARLRCWSDRRPGERLGSAGKPVNRARVGMVRPQRIRELRRATSSSRRARGPPPRPPRTPPATSSRRPCSSGGVGSVSRPPPLRPSRPISQREEGRMAAGATARTIDTAQPDTAPHFDVSDSARRVDDRAE